MFANSVIFRNKETDERFIWDKRELKYFLEDFELTAEQVEELPLSEATAEQLAEVLESELEGANYHSLVTLPRNLLKSLSDDLTEAQRVKLMWALADSLEGLY